LDPDSYPNAVFWNAGNCQQHFLRLTFKFDFTWLYFILLTVEPLTDNVNKDKQLVGKPFKS